MEYKGDLKGFPKEVVEWMLDEQERQGNKRDVSVFERDSSNPKSHGGISWVECRYFSPRECSDIIENKNFDIFFNKFPKKQEFPCEMWCWDCDMSSADKVFVIGKSGDLFICTYLTYKEELIKRLNNTSYFREIICFYKNASLEKPVKQYSIEEAEKEFNIKIKE